MNLRTGASLSGMLAIAVASVLYMNSLGLGLHLTDHNKTATVQVPDTNGLVVGSRVLLRGIAIGSIKAIDPAAGGVRIALTYQDRYRIPVDSRFRIDDLSALGEVYLAVLPAGSGGPYLADNAAIPATDVAVPATIQDLSARLTRLLDQVRPDQIQQIFDQLNIALPDNGIILVNLSQAWSLMADMAVSRSDDLSTVLTKLQPLLTDSSWIPPGLAGATDVLRKLGVGMGGWLDSSVGDVFTSPLPEGISEGTGPFIAKLQQFLDKTAPDLKVLGIAVLPSVRAAAAAMQTINISNLLNTALADSAGGRITIHVGIPTTRK